MTDPKAPCPNCGTTDWTHRLTIGTLDACNTCAPPADPATAPEVFPTNEGLRILVAVRDGTLTTNGAGRYVIEGQARPDRKTRELLTRRGLIENRYQMGLGHYWLLTDEGRDALEGVGFDVR